VAYLLSNAATSATLLFIPLLASDLGANGILIGLIVAAYNSAQLAANYIFGRAADQHGRRLFMRLGLLASGAAFVVQLLAFDPWSLLAVRVLCGFAAGIYPADLLAHAYESKSTLGKITSMGSLGWGLGSFVAGLLAIYSNVFLFSSLLFFSAFAVTLTIPETEEKRMRVPFFPVAIIRKNLPAYLAMLIRHSGAAGIWVIFPLFLKESLGCTSMQIGIVYFVNLGTQFLVMPYIDRFDSVKLVMTGLVLSALSFVSFTVASNFWEMLPTQVTLGIAWAALYVGVLKYIMERNVERATSTGLLNSTLSIASITGAFLGGAVAFAWGYHAVMYVAAMMVLFALFLFRFQTHLVPDSINDS